MHLYLLSFLWGLFVLLSAFGFSNWFLFFFFLSSVFTHFFSDAFHLRNLTFWLVSGNGIFLDKGGCKLILIHNFLFFGLIRELEDNIRLVHSFIDQKISTLAFPSPMLTTKTLNLNIAGIKFSNSFVIKLEPLSITFSNVAEIVAEVSSSIVNHNTPQLVSELSINFRDALFFWQCIVVDVEILWELPSRIYLLVFEAIIIEAHPLEMNDKVVRSFFQETALRNIAFFLASVTLIVRNNFACNVLVEWFLDVLPALNL